MPAIFPVTEAVGIVEHVLRVHVMVDWPVRVTGHRFPGLDKPPHERIRLKLRLLLVQGVGEGVLGDTGVVVRFVVPDSVFIFHRCPPFPGIPVASQCWGGLFAKGKLRDAPMASELDFTQWVIGWTSVEMVG